MSVVATAGAAAWVVPEIMTAKPAAGASLSLTRGGGGGDGGGDGGDGGDSPPIPPPPPSAGQTPPTPDGPTSTPFANESASPATPGTLAFTGVDIQRDAEIGAALVAGGWAMHHWASRRPRSAADGERRQGKPESTDSAS